jgi:glycosyltransferase involved in cell wall biosynthesis/tetratricopeptide (TPR) repeat protein
LLLLRLALAWPGLPVTRTRVGCALARGGRFADAVSHLRRAVAGNPFDLDAARALHQARVDAGDAAGAVGDAAERRLIRRAAPTVVPAELWFVSPTASRPPGRRLRLIWEGAHLVLHSFAQVNRELCRRLLDRGHELCLLDGDPVPAGAENVPALRALLPWLNRPLSGPADAHVRHQWPLSPVPPPAGPWVVIQPWEFGSPPRDWLPLFAGDVDEVWVPSAFVRDCYLAAGVPGERVVVVPNGVDTAVFRPAAPPLPLHTRKRWKFLFVGGTLHRKGIDVLLAAYSRAFTPGDDVCLVIKDMGTQSYYRGETAQDRVRAFQAAAGTPEVEYLDADLAAEELAGLYTACDCLVHPYRAEGYGLPVAEALASGLPVIVTGYGAAADFCDDRVGYLVPSRLAYLASGTAHGLPLAARGWLAEPDADALAGLLRHAAAHPEEARAKGRAGRARAEENLTWERAVDLVEARVAELASRTPQRFGRVTAAAVPAAPPREPAGSLVAPAVVAEAPTASVIVTAAPADEPYGGRRSLCLIVKNEEANLPDCLASAAGLFDETVVVDTGSTDRTKDIARAHGARVFDFPWIDSFAAARNECLRQASGEWIFWLDADDRLDAPDRDKLRALFSGLKDEHVAYVLKCVCDSEPGTSPTVVDHVRLFRRRADVRWEHRVHEQILPSIRRSGGEVRWADAAVRHVGYRDPALRRNKLDRDLRLLHREREELGDHPFTLFNLGSVYQELGRYDDAIPVLRQSLAKSHPKDSIVRKLYALLTHCQRSLGKRAEALAVCQGGLGHYPDDAELLFIAAVLQEEFDDLAGAEAALTRLITTEPGAHFASVAAGLRGYKARCKLAEVLLKQGRAAEAEAQWWLAVREEPRSAASWMGLGQMLLGQRRFDEAAEAAAKLEALKGAENDGVALRAQIHMARDEFATAKEALGRLIAAAPQWVYPRVLLSRTLLQEGTDLDAAEQALLDVLELDPSNAEAKHNLEILHRQRQAARDLVLSGGLAPD